MIMGIALSQRKRIGYHLKKRGYSGLKIKTRTFSDDLK